MSTPKKGPAWEPSKTIIFRGDVDELEKHLGTLGYTLYNNDGGELVMKDDTARYLKDEIIYYGDTVYIWEPQGLVGIRRASNHE